MNAMKKAAGANHNVIFDQDVDRRRVCTLHQAVTALTGCPSLTFCSFPRGRYDPSHYFCAVCGKREGTGSLDEHSINQHVKTELAMMEALTLLYRNQEKTRELLEASRKRVSAEWERLKDGLDGCE